MIGAGGAEGAINAGDILKPYLARGEIKCIGCTTTSEYNNSILKDKALARRFEVINIKEPTKNEMYKLLAKVKCEYEEFHKIKISNKLIRRLVDLSDYYMKNIINPDKSIDLLDSSCAYAKMNSNSMELTEDDIINTLKYKTNNKLINNKYLIKNILNDLSNITSKDNILHLKETLNEESNLPKSILIDNDEIKNIFIRNLEDINIINLDLNKYNSVVVNKYNFLNRNLYLKNIFDKPISESIFYSLVEKPFTLIFINHINDASKFILDEITKINKEGFITYKYNEKIYFNNAIIIASTDDDIIFQTGFNKRVLNYKLPQNFLDSFKCIIKETKLKEISY